MDDKSRESIRHAIIAAKGSMTIYALTRAAQAHCPKLSQTAVSEYLNGKRDMQASRVEALLKALDLHIVPVRPSRKR